MNTKKKLGILLILCLSVFSVQTASAQIRFGVRGGVDVASANMKASMLKVNNRVGFQVGASMDAKIPIIGLGIETGAQFGHKDYKGHSDDVGNKISNYNYVMVPLLLKKEFSLLGIAGIYVKGGMYANFRVSGGNVTINNEKYEPLKFQKGAMVGAGITLFSHLELGMQYRYRIGKSYHDGLTNMGNFNKLERNNWTVSLAYYL